MTTIDLSQVRARRLAGDHSGVLELLGPAQDDEPDDVAFERGRANYELENWFEAVEALEPLPLEYCSAPMVAVALAVSCHQIGRLHEAFTVAARVEHPGFAALATDFAIEAGDREQAEAQLERVRQLEPAHPRIPELEESLENIDEELAAVRAAWNEEPSSASALRALCQALFERDMETHAYELAHIAVEEAEHDPEVWRVFVEFIRKAEVSVEDQVDTILSEALSLIAFGMATTSEELCHLVDAPQMRAVEAYALLRDDRDEEAHALAEGLDDPLARYVVAWAKARAGEGTEALHAMLESEDDPWIVGLVWLALAVVHYQTGDYRPALEHAERAIEVLSEVPEASPADIGRACIIASSAHEKLGDFFSMRIPALLGLEVVAEVPPHTGLCENFYLLLHNSFYNSFRRDVGEAQDVRISVDFAEVRARRLAGDYAGVLELLGPAQDDESIDVALERRRANFELGNVSEVIDGWDLLPEPYLKLVVIAYPIFSALKSLGRLQEAFELAVQLPDGQLEFWNFVGWSVELAISMGDRKQAEAQLERLRELAPDDRHIPELEEALEDIDEELADARAAWDDERWSVSALRALCQELFERDMETHALELARVAVEESEHDPDLWRVFVELMREADLSIEDQVEIILPAALSQIAVGRARIGQEMSQMVDDPKMRPVEAYALLRQSRDEEARVLAEGLEDPLARYVVAWAKAHAGEGPAALHAMLESESDPWITGLVWLALAATYYRADDYRPAIEHAERAVEILSEVPEASSADIGWAYRIAAASHGELGDFLSMRTAASFGLEEVADDLPPSSSLCKDLRVLFHNSFD